MITVEKAKIVLDRFACGKLLHGCHAKPNGECKVCVEELRCLMGSITWDGAEPILGEVTNWTDRPDGGTPTELACQNLNDGDWSSDEARTAACLKLVTLAEKDASSGWGEKYRELTIRHIVSLALESAARVHPEEKHQTALRSAAKKCRESGTYESATEATKIAVFAGARYGVAYGNHGYAAYYAPYYDDPGTRDRILRLGVELLMASHQGREPNLWALGLSEFAFALKPTFQPGIQP